MTLGPMLKSEVKDRKMDLNCSKGGNSLVVQWLGLGAFTGLDSIPGRGQGTKIPQATQ